MGTRSAVIVIQATLTKGRGDLPNTDRMRHTLASAAWGLLSIASFEEAVVQAVNALPVAVELPTAAVEMATM